MNICAMLNLFISSKAKQNGRDINVKEVMDTWTLQMGYPVIKVTRNGGKVTATQERFLLNPRGNLSTEFTSPYE